MTLKNAKTILFASLIAAIALTFSGITTVVADNQSYEKDLLEDKLKDRMQKLADKDQNERELDMKYTSEQYGIPYNLVYESDGKLIVGIDAEKTSELQMEYTKDDVKSDLDTDMDLDVKYFVFERESNVRGGDAVTNPPEGATITVVKNNKIITTGHAFEEGDILNAGLVGGIGCQEIIITEDSNYSGAFADSAYGIVVPQTDCGYTYVNDSIHYGSRNLSVTYGDADDITLYKHIKIAGIHTTSSGYILDTDVTIRTPIEGVLNDQVIGSYRSVPGDSGAPIFSLTSSSSALLLGQHVGRACEVDLHSGSNYAYWCGANSSGGLKFFSPWDQVEAHLGI